MTTDPTRTNLIRIQHNGSPVTILGWNKDNINTINFIDSDPPAAGTPPNQNIILNWIISFNPTSTPNRINVTPDITIPTSRVLAHTTKTVNTPFAATSEANANPIITTPGLILDGATPVQISFFTPRLDNAVGIVQTFFIVLSRDTTSTTPPIGGTVVIGKWANPDYDSRQPGGVSNDDQVFPCYLTYQETPPAGTHTYTVSAYATATVGTAGGTVVGGAGGSGNPAPAFLRVEYDR